MCSYVLINNVVDILLSFFISKSIHSSGSSGRVRGGEKHKIYAGPSFL